MTDLQQMDDLLGFGAFSGESAGSQYDALGGLGAAPYDPMQGGAQYPGEEGFVDQRNLLPTPDPSVFDLNQFWWLPPGNTLPPNYLPPSYHWLEEERLDREYAEVRRQDALRGIVRPEQRPWDFGRDNLNQQPPFPPDFWQQWNDPRNYGNDLYEQNNRFMYMPDINGYIPHYNFLDQTTDWGYPEGEGPGGYTQPTGGAAMYEPPPEWYEPVSA